MDLFTEDEQGLPKINLELKTIICFRKLIERDKGSKGDSDGREKKFATLEAAYIFWEGKYGSSYTQEFPDYNIRLAKIRKETGLPETWNPDDLVKECLDWFVASQRTKSMKLVENVEKVIDSMTDYFTTLDLTETIKTGSHSGELKHDINKVQKAIKELPETIDAVKKMKDIVKEEISEKVTGKGGRDINMFEEKRKK